MEMRETELKVLLTKVNCIRTREVKKLISRSKHLTQINGVKIFQQILQIYSKSIAKNTEMIMSKCQYKGINVSAD